MLLPHRGCLPEHGGKAMSSHTVVPREDWIAARKAFLTKEKEFTKLRDELSRQRRDLPWEKVDKDYSFETANGTASLGDLFQGRNQLIVYHFMFAPEWDEPCSSCSFWADNFNGIPVHLAHRDTTFIAISRAPLEKLDAFKERMGWSFDWVSSGPSNFNYDYQASFTPEEVEAGSALFNYAVGDPYVSDREGISVFFKDENGAIYHTYSCHARGIDMMNAAYHYLDLTPKGRDEEGLDSPQDWVRFHDRY